SQGTVTKQAGAVVAGAGVSLHSVSTCSDLQYVTSSTGSFFFPSIAPGAYQLHITGSGFSKTTVNAVVGANEVRGVNVELHVGTHETVVDVSTSSGGVNPDETRVQATLTSG